MPACISYNSFLKYQEITSGRSISPPTSMEGYLTLEPAPAAFTTPSTNSSNESKVSPLRDSISSSSEAHTFSKPKLTVSLATPSTDPTTPSESPPRPLTIMEEYEQLNLHSRIAALLSRINVLRGSLGSSETSLDEILRLRNPRPVNDSVEDVRPVEEDEPARHDKPAGHDGPKNGLAALRATETLRPSERAALRRGRAQRRRNCETLVEEVYKRPS